MFSRSTDIERIPEEVECPGGCEDDGDGLVPAWTGGETLVGKISGEIDAGEGDPRENDHGEASVAEGESRKEHHRASSFQRGDCVLKALPDVYSFCYQYTNTSASKVMTGLINAQPINLQI